MTDDPRTRFWSLTAADLMTPDPIRIERAASVARAIALLDENAVSALPVVDDDGRPVGVVSRADVAHHFRRPVVQPSLTPTFYERVELEIPPEAGDEWWPSGASDDERAATPVGDIMTPEVYGVTPEAPVGLVVRTMRCDRVHRLFVIDRHGALRGVVSALDILAALETPEEADPLAVGAQRSAPD